MLVTPFSVDSEANNCVADMKLRFSCTIGVTRGLGTGGRGGSLATVCTKNRNVRTALRWNRSTFCEWFRLYGAFLEIFRGYVFSFCLVLAVCVGLCALRRYDVWVTRDPHDTGDIPVLYLLVPCLAVCRRNIQESTVFYSLVASVTVECVFCGMRAETEETVEHEHIIHRNTAGWQHCYRSESVVVFFPNKGTTDEGGCKKLCADNSREQLNRIVITE